MPLYRIETTRKGAGSEPVGRTVQLGSSWEDLEIKAAVSTALKGTRGRQIQPSDEVEHFNYGNVFIGEVDDNGGRDGYWLRREYGRMSAIPFYRVRVGAYGEHWGDMPSDALDVTVDLRADPADVRKLDTYVDGVFFGAFSFEDMLKGAVLGIHPGVVRAGQVQLDDEPEFIEEAKVALDYFLEHTEVNPELSRLELAVVEPLVERQRVKFGPNEFKPIANYEVDVSFESGTVTHVDEHNINIKLDQFFPDLIEWQNEVIYALSEGDDRPAVVALPAESKQLELAREFAWDFREQVTDFDYAERWRQRHDIDLPVNDEALLAEFIRRNQEHKDDSICASHDFTDANMNMLAAFERVMGREPELEDEADTALWNDAWDLAKAHDFFVGADFVRAAIDEEI